MMVFELWALELMGVWVLGGRLECMVVFMSVEYIGFESWVLQFMGVWVQGFEFRGVWVLR
jgi:hypothetical protein